MFDRQLAKWHLEKEGYLASMGVDLGGLGVVDVVGIKMQQNCAGQAVFGVVRGWWYSGAYLTPGQIRNHLQTDRRLLDRAFSAAVMRQFGLSDPPEKVLFYSKRSRSMADEAERELAASLVRVVYLEDVLAAALAEARAEEPGEDGIFQALAMMKGSHIFKTMVRLARQAERAKATAGEPRRVPDRDKQQLDFLARLLVEDEGGNDPTA
jgi:hypothetical protein